MQGIQRRVLILLKFFNMKVGLLAFGVIFYLHAPSQTYISNTNVVDVIKMRIIAGETVAITNGKISNVGESGKIKIPVNANVIDGSGKYLIPGFVDAHVHFFQSGGLYTRPDVIDLRKYHSYKKEIAWVHDNMEDFLRRYLSAGITTVIDVGSTKSFLKQRDSFKTKSYAPTIFMTGGLLTTYEPNVFKGLGDDEPFYKMNTEEEARKFVRQQLPYKPDFIKIWYIVSGNIDSGAKASEHLVKAVIDEAHKNNLKVAVHATERITAQLAVESGADYLVHSVDDEVVDNDFIQLLKKHKVVLCPTLVVMDNYSRVLGQQYQPSLADSALANPVTRSSLFDLERIPDSPLVNGYKKRVRVRLNSQNTADSVMLVNLRNLVDAGVVIATGTDAGNIGTLHASSYFDELNRMQEAGLSISQILQCSTINGAKALGKENEFGSIEIGKRANMVLLDANPLDNLSNWRKVSVIINKGVALKANELIKK
jgi:imidazolonepropionase-like amidohydrolase